MKQLLALDSSHVALLLAAVSALLSICFAASVYRRAKTQRLRLEQRLECVLQMLRALSDEHSPEEQLLPLLRAVSHLVKAEYYACYLREGSSPVMRLRALCQQDDGGQKIEIGYSRLTAYDQSRFLPPLTLNCEDLPAEIALRSDGPQPQLLVPLAQHMGLVLIGPTKRCTTRQMAELGAWQVTVGPVLAAIAFQSNSHQAPDKQLVSNQAGCEPGEPKPLQQLLRLLQRLTQSDGSALMAEQDGKACLLAATDQQAERDLQDSHAISDLLALLGAREMLLLTPGTALHSQAPPSMVMLGDHLCLLSIPTPHHRAAALLWSAQPLILAEHQELLQRALLRRIAALIAAEGGADQAAPTTLSELRAAIGATEQLLPQSSRHSELVARYALAIAKELQLPEASCRSVALAALLHDIGMAALPTGLLTKPGTYSQAEHDLVMLHPDFGADVLSATLGDAQVANIVRQHHERWDGQGYPRGLAGDTISLEGRVLTTADLFVAKLSGRGYRKPLPFEQAIAAMRSAAGKQLDPQVTQALLDWYAKKAAALSDPFQPLAPCWVMRCCPDSLRLSCPAYTQREINCWRVPDADCDGRSGECASCMVYTEYIYRSRQAR